MSQLTLTLAIAIVAAGTTACSVTGENGKRESVQANASVRVVLASEIEWEHLNPARGDKSPQAGTLWGDRKAAVATGFLVKFVDGFSSPPHTHNVSYRGVVVRGRVHNDDPSAAKMWMPAGSFWTQPKGEVHITAAKGRTNVAYIEIEDGPYLVLPVEKAFDSGERPINVDASNIVWVDAPGTFAPNMQPKVAYLWGAPSGGAMYGTLVKLPAGFAGAIRSRGATFRAVVIQGQPAHGAQGDTKSKTMDPGSYFSSKEEATHPLSCKSGGDCILYVRTNGSFDIASGLRKK